MICPSAIRISTSTQTKAQIQKSEKACGREGYQGKFLFVVLFVIVNFVAGFGGLQIHHRITAKAPNLKENSVTFLREKA